MALIELHAPPRRDRTDDKKKNVQDTFLDLTTGISGVMPPQEVTPPSKPSSAWEEKAADTYGRSRDSAKPPRDPDSDSWNERVKKLPGYKANAILATGVAPDFESLALNVAILTDQEFDDILYATAETLEEGHAFELTPINQLSIPARTVMVIKIDTPTPRYFKAYVRGNPYHTRGHPAFKSRRTTLEFEELKYGRVYWPMSVVLRNDTLTVLNSRWESKTLGPDDTELCFTLRPEAETSTEGPVVSPTPARALFSEPIPIAKIEFRGSAIGIGDRPIVEPEWIESVKISASFSRSFVESTYLITLNQAGRPKKESDKFKFTMYFVDRAISIEAHDPTVVVEPQDR